MIRERLTAQLLGGRGARHRATVTERLLAVQAQDLRRGRGSRYGRARRVDQVGFVNSVTADLQGNRALPAVASGRARREGGAMKERDSEESGYPTSVFLSEGLRAPDLGLPRSSASLLGYARAEDAREVPSRRSPSE
jgi:hypothetical protein